jgi:hypothetical protein
MNSSGMMFEAFYVFYYVIESLEDVNMAISISKLEASETVFCILLAD